MGSASSVSVGAAPAQDATHDQLHDILTKFGPKNSRASLTDSLDQPEVVYIGGDIQDALCDCRVQKLLRGCMASEYSEELLDFYLATTDIEGLRFARASQEIINTRILKNVIEPFLLADSPCAINLKPVHRDMLKPTLPETMSALHAARSEALLLIRQRFWGKFLRSERGTRIETVDKDAALKKNLEAMARRLSERNEPLKVPVRRDAPEVLACALGCPKIQGMFHSFLSMRHCAELLEFYLYSFRILHSSGGVSTASLLSKLEYMCETFLSEHSPAMINIGAKRRAAVIEAVQSLSSQHTAGVRLESGLPCELGGVQCALGALREAHEEVYLLLKQGHWPTFLGSQIGSHIMFRASASVSEEGDGTEAEAEAEGPGS